ncbi:MAG TPA: hypothetical protein VLA11_00060 [Woeseiaceae bacterium]|nr:hypothetical protein [Woeseiaceae bacterium]
MRERRSNNLHLLAAGLLWAFPAQAALGQDEPSNSQLEWGFDFSLVNSSGHPSWLEGSGGKLRFDENNDGALFSRGFLDYRTRLASTVTAHVLSEIYDDGHGPTIDLTEAYLSWRPMLETATRLRMKVGAFYPRISLENVGPGWASPYSINPSAINTWVGEELRSVGAEFTLSRRLQSLGGAHTVSLNVAVFGGNDPAGGLIAWKGWSIHDRQSRFNDEIPLPPIPRIQPGNWWDEQDPFITPLLEIDEELGYYVNLEWKYGKRLLVRAMHYDNRADPMGLEDRQFAWWTYFDHVAVQASLPGDIGLLAQWMDGFTAWGRYRDGVYSVDNRFRSNYVLLTRPIDRHRITARYDHFELSEADTTPLDENSEQGHAWTLAYRYAVNDNVSLAAEWLRIHTTRPAWAYFDLDESQTERQVQLSILFRFGDQ